jgi:hypothetical protein
MNAFKRGYQPRRNALKDENGFLLGDSYNILNMWKNYCSKLLNVHSNNDIRQIEIYTVELLVYNSSPFEVKNCYCKVSEI